MLEVLSKPVPLIVTVVPGVPLAGERLTILSSVLVVVVVETGLPMVARVVVVVVEITVGVTKGALFLFDSIIRKDTNKIIIAIPITKYVFLIYL